MAQIYSENLNKIKRYSGKNYKSTDELTNIIHEYTHACDNDVEYAFTIFKKIVPYEKIIHELLTYDLLTYTSPVKVCSLDQFINIAIFALKKFQYRVGGYDIEDEEWILVDNNNQRFKIKNNNKILYNSIGETYNTTELEWFLENITKYIQSHADEKVFTVKNKIIEDEHHCISWVLFVFTDKS